VLGGTMGAAVGERVVRAYDRARDLRLPVVVATRSGGARLQEGMVALVQLPRTVSAARRHAAAGLLSLGVYGSPTTGGVYASFGSLVDVRAATEHAVIGFAGPRVAEGTLGESLPPGSHTAEAAYEEALVDALLAPTGAADWVDVALGRTDRPLPTRPLPAWADPGVDGAWGEVLRARAVGRPTGIDRAARLCTSWLELRGADAVVRAGLATVADRRCVVVATDRYHRDGRPTPAGYRLAQRAVGLAGRLGLPVVTLVDTPGADPSPASEADGLAYEIAHTFEAMAGCPTPIVSVCVGEGGSGGALALSYADRLLMTGHAVFSVIGPEGAAAILERNPARGADVADLLRLTSADMLALGVVDKIIAEGQTALEVAVAAALDTAVPGEREARFDRVTARWIEG
jgi:acetyl-CoA carboxylase carboxyl transferase subunit beta